MLNLLIRSDRYIGYLERELTPEEIEVGEFTVIPVEKLPEVIANVPTGHYVAFDGESFTTVAWPAVPEPPKSPEQLKIDQLEAEHALVSLELMDTQIMLEQLQREQAALLLELVEREVL
ncbi:hypothetical protein [Paenibacillus kobensis]|uniref:hypothetical protein n=1 Tax=Paenibacillus kobensis TaxID=59841 RepID=UPI000FD84D52|nr:hypothetical protein [Paenibacillus kobensis]